MTFQHQIANLTEGVSPALSVRRRLVTTAEVLALTDGTDQVPVELVPAAGAGKVIYVDGVYIRSIPPASSPAAYTGGTVAVAYTGASGTLVSAGTGAASPVRGTTARTMRMGLGQSPTLLTANAAVELRAASASTPVATGNADLQVTVTYRIVEV